MITILAAGSRGDTQPYLALGAALKRAGHPVRIATFAIYEDLVRGAGLELFPLSGRYHPGGTKRSGYRSHAGG